MASSGHEKLFKCLKLFQVEESSPVAGGETPFNSIGEYFSIMGGAGWLLAWGSQLTCIVCITFVCLNQD